MNANKPMITLGVLLALACLSALAGPLDPDCTAEKAAKSAAAKATIGVGGRCSPAEAAHDTARDAVHGDDDEGLLGGDKDKDKNNNKGKDKGKNKDKDKDKDDNKPWTSG